jgi:hypothetical protein
MDLTFMEVRILISNMLEYEYSGEEEVEYEVQQ